MSDTPRDFTLERINRLAISLADLTDSQAAQGRQFMAMMQRMVAHLERIENKLADVSRSMHELASEQILLGNRVENALSRSQRAHIRLDDIEPSSPSTSEDKR